MTVFLPDLRILNRISADVFTVDDGLPFIMNIFLANLVGVVCPIIVCTYAVPWILIGESMCITFRWHHVLSFKFFSILIRYFLCNVFLCCIFSSFTLGVCAL